MQPLTSFGRTLVIANPAARAGTARQVAERLERFLTLYLHDASTFITRYTDRPGHATELAADAAPFDTVLALGGDGVIHEVACGLMRLDEDARPVLGVIPVGSGNDFARTLGMHEVSCDADLAQLLETQPARLDIGRVRTSSSPTADAPLDEVTYALETFSFGLDAAIALDTTELRRTTGLTGMPLYTVSGLNVFGRRYRTYPAGIRLDDGPWLDLATLLCAVQLGPTYGSGYLITPDADPTDGMLDICYATGPIARVQALPVFLSARNGNHVGNPHVHLARARRAEIVLPEDGYPAQVDGEKLAFRRAVIEVAPAALTVLKPPANPA